MAESTTLTVRISGDIKERLEKLARQQRRTKSYLAQEAIAAFVLHQEWWEQTIAAARASEDATEEEERAFFDKWK